MITIQYVFFHILLLVIFYVYSCRIAKEKSTDKYWTILWIPITAFTIEEGFRWGRHIDWCAYYYQYQDMLKGYSTTHEPFFRLIWNTFAYLELPYYIVVAFCSFLLIYSLCFFCKPYWKYAYILLPFLVVWIAPKAINLIRWYMAFSFLLIGLRLFLDNKKKIAFIVFALSFFTHYAISLLIPLFLCVTYIKKFICKPWIAILVSLGLILFFNLSFMKNFVFIVELFSGVGRFAGYVENAEGWLTGAGQNAIIERRSVIIYIISCIPFYLYIWYGKKCSNKLIKEDVILYNLAVLGLCLRSVSSGLELASRYASMFDPFLVVMAVKSLIYFGDSKRKFRLVFISIIILSMGVQFVRFCAPMEREEFMHYIWNKQISPSYLFNLYIIGNK